MKKHTFNLHEKIVGTSLLYDVGVSLKKSEEAELSVSQIQKAIGLEPIASVDGEYVSAVDHMSFWGISFDGDLVRIDFRFWEDEIFAGYGEVIVQEII